jgi:hypothetical protein
LEIESEKERKKNITGGVKCRRRKIDFQLVKELVIFKFSGVILKFEESKGKKVRKEKK